ncbi:MAG: cytidine deaminase [Elusimicrobiaceae bacterium]|nr:cytidine deaminase [Elusimicrobiaceae bacterium]
MFTPEIEQQLIETAIAARAHSYSPYSEYKVGAAALGGSGKIYSGCNVENASYGLSNCAERTAIFTAIAAGETKIKALCVAAKVSNPCGACRQVMMEFMAGSSPVTTANVDDETGKYRLQRFTLADLLPRAFDPKKAGL